MYLHHLVLIRALADIFLRLVSGMRSILDAAEARIRPIEGESHFL